jgi:hypothetical protein
VDLGTAICKDLGIHWNDYDRFRQMELTNAPASLNMHTSMDDGEGGEYGDALSADTLPGMDSGSSIGIGGSPEHDISQIEKEVAQGDNRTSDEIFQTLVDEGGLTALEKYVMYRLFNLDGEGYETEKEILGNINGVLSPEQRFGEDRFRKVISKTLRKLSRYIASITSGTEQEEYDNLKRIYMYRVNNIKHANDTEHVHGYTGKSSGLDDEDDGTTATKPDYTKWREIRKANKEKAAQARAEKKSASDEHKKLRTGGLFD